MKIKILSLSEFKNIFIKNIKEVDEENINIIYTLYIKNVEMPYSSIMIDENGKKYMSIDSDKKEETVENVYSQYLKFNSKLNILDVAENFKKERNLNSFLSLEENQLSF